MPAHPLAALDAPIALGVAAQLDLHRPLRTHQLPGIAVTKPFVGLLDLPAIGNDLIEDTELIADTVAQGGQLQRRHRIEKTGGKSSQTAIAKPWLFLLGQQFVEIKAELGHCLLHLVENPEIDQVIAKMRPHQEFGRQISDCACSLSGVGRGSADPALQQAVAHHEGERQITVGAACQRRKLALHVKEIVKKSAFERVLAQACAVFFALGFGGGRALGAQDLGRVHGKTSFGG